MTPVDPHADSEVSFRRHFLIATGVAGAAAAIVLVSFPEIDLWTTMALRDLCGQDSPLGWCRGPAILAARYGFMAVYFLSCLVAIAGLAWTARRGCHALGLCSLRWMLLAVALGVGPGLVANLVLKDNWGRARPRDVIEFGGKKEFTPPLIPSHQCGRNCSFVSGEASSIFTAAFAASMLWPQARAVLLVGGIAAGFGAGLVRMSQGAHFLSDIVFAGVFMALTVSLLHVLLVGVWRHLDFATLRREIVLRIEHALPVWRFTPSATAHDLQDPVH